MENIINSSQNKICKHIRLLHQKKYRDEYNEYLVEGIKMANEALDFNADISFAVIEDEYLKNNELNILYQSLIDRKYKVFIVSHKLLKEIAETESPQGIILVIRKKNFVKEIDLLKKNVKIVILDSVQDPGNVGTIVRTADAFNSDAVVLSKSCADLYNGKTIRSTMGSVFHIPIIDNVPLEDYLIELKGIGLTLMGADPYSNINICEAKKYDRVAIIIGNESKGISKAVRSLLDVTFKIPMPGKAESLNAGVAAAISMYELFL